MSIARHHAEWLSLVPVSGPFLSLPVLMEAFNAGLEAHDPEHVRLLRQEYAKWQESFDKRKSDPAPHHNWIKFVLTKTLEFDDRVLVEGQTIPQTLQVEIPEHHELLRPSIVVNDPTTKKARLLVQTYPRTQELTGYVANSPWKASPDTRMTELLHGTGVRLGLVTNGEHWMLVDAPKGETSGYASWYASLWLEEPITLRAFRSLLSASRFFNVPEDQTLEALLKKSASNQQEVTDQLGYQVRQAVEVLIREIAKIEHEPEINVELRMLIAEIPEPVLYESALTVMMRLVFLFCAEERELIPSKPFPVYEQNYSVSTISKQLRELADQHGEELLERRYDAWPRLLAAFRAVYGGLKHDDVHIPAYGGNLFNPDRFPFLEGRKRGTSWKDGEANPLPVNNRTVLHLLEALQLLQVKVPGGGPAEARRLSFRALDIEQIGHVYEGLLDHTAKRAAKPFLGLAGTRDKEPEIPLAELEKHLEKGEAHLVKFLKGETGRSESALKKSLKVELDSQDVARLRTACQGDAELWKRVEPFAGLVRLDSFGYPVVIPQGSVFVTAGTDRRSSGTHYTPKSLTEPIVQYTLEPLVYVGPAEGLPKDQWKLRPARELLELKVCDMACGSGAFLVQACRYLSERLLEAWEESEKESQLGHQDTLFENRRRTTSTVRITPYGLASEGGLYEQLVPLDLDERLTYARRVVAQRCLYGVDKNPLAAEMAKLSLWLLTLAKDKPFEFLDHAIRCGDSLVGIHNTEQLRKFNLDGKGEDNRLFLDFLDEKIKEAIALRRQITEMQANTVEDVETQDRMLREANEKIDRLKCAADMLIGAEFTPGSPANKRAARDEAAIKVAVHFHDSDLVTFRREASKALNDQMTFHWPLEFPEVMVERGGFDGFVGNPPFMGGSKITGQLGTEYRTFIVNQLTSGDKGKADLSGYFLLRASICIRSFGILGLISTNSIAQGDNRKICLEALVESAFTIARAYSDLHWPGLAGVTVAVLWIRSQDWKGACVLNDSTVSGISSFLTPLDETSQQPDRLPKNIGLAFRGTEVKGQGFILEAGDAQRLLEQDNANKDVIFPFLTGEDLNSRPDQSPSRFVINFHEWSIEKASQYQACFHIVTDLVKPFRDTITKQIHEPAYWKFWDKRLESYARISRLPRVLVRSEVGNMHSLAFSPTGIVFSNKIIVIGLSTSAAFACLQSSIHEEWSRRFGGAALRTDMCYSAKSCFETFPFLVEALEEYSSRTQNTTLNDIGDSYYNHRQQVMHRRGDGLTKTYNRFHNPDESCADIQKLRELHVEMDNAVAAAYGWTDLGLGHGFHETKQGVRYTISERARREVLARLLKLNHERYAEEVKQGLHEKKKGGAGRVKGGGKKKQANSEDGETLFHGEEDA
jgi:hypothetical protein